MTVATKAIEKEKIIIPFGIKEQLKKGVMPESGLTILMEVTPEIAAEWLKNNHENRPIKPSNVTFLSNQMQGGKWQFNGESIKHDKDGNLLDGQHRLLGVVDSGVTIVTNVTIGLDRATFHTIDTGKNRNANDAVAIAGYPNPQVLARMCTFILRYETAISNKANKAKR